MYCKKKKKNTLLLHKNICIWMREFQSNIPFSIVSFYIIDSIDGVRFISENET